VDIKLKLAGLWTAVTFCYVYGDLFGFFRQDTITDIASGKGGFIATQSGLLFAALSIVVPSLMPFMCLIMRARVSRIANLIVGGVYTAFVFATIAGAWHYYVFLSVVEIMLTLLIVRYAWQWPESKAVEDPA
jgi:hypothetical protein